MHSATGASCPKVEHACIVGLQFMYEIGDADGTSRSAGAYLTAIDCGVPIFTLTSWTCAVLY